MLAQLVVGSDNQTSPQSESQADHVAIMKYPASYGRVDIFVIGECTWGSLYIYIYI